MVTMIKDYFIHGETYDRIFVEKLLGNPLRDVDKLVYPVNRGAYFFAETENGLLFEGLKPMTDTKLLFLSKAWKQD
jgi:hypothetical protein